MQQIRYIIGAGFSAPLGLPTRANFLERAKDMLFRHPDRYGHHHSLVREFDQIAKIGIYCKTDPLDIEEALSVIEMENFAKARRTKKPFLDLISDTVEYYSRALEKIEGPVEEEWTANPFGPHTRINLYGVFVASLLGLRLYQQAHESEHLSEPETEYIGDRLPPRSAYGVISTNWDLVLERFADAITQHYRTPANTGFLRPVVDDSADQDDEEDPATETRVPLVKLHGSVDGDIQLLPTWARSTHKKAAQIWEHGLNQLSQANHIRILGHALAETDLHLRTLIKTAVLATPHLKTIDVICRDSDGSVRRRYRSFFPFRGFRFVDADILSYLKFLSDWYVQHARDRNALNTALFDDAHEAFMQRSVEASRR